MLMIREMKERKRIEEVGGRVAFDMRCNSCTKTNFDEVTAFLADRKSVQAHSKKGRTWISLYRLPKKTVLSFFQQQQLIAVNFA